MTKNHMFTQNKKPPLRCRNRRISHLKKYLSITSKKHIKPLANFLHLTVAIKNILLQPICISQTTQRRKAPSAHRTYNDRNPHRNISTKHTTK